MATTTKKVEKICQIVCLKQLVMRWKLRCRPVLSYDDSDALPTPCSNQRILYGSWRSTSYRSESGS
ncbi:hypothetical protein C1H46_013105 [Malus baccata]|uniref:Uncharacterized protein n=1 Tax=Malus baccata TaxID=106549 RepID=A0A540MR63_MALBA|nr:hypothetical protein C1H46_013105 [Malus baccata]